jgi:hypothetical protein
LSAPYWGTATVEEKGNPWFSIKYDDGDQESLNLVSLALRHAEGSPASAKRLMWIADTHCTAAVQAQFQDMFKDNINLTWELAEATLAADEQEEDPHEQEEDPSEDLESEEPVHSGSPGKRKRGVGRACRCGSTTHQRISHKECQFYQKATHG